MRNREPKQMGQFEQMVLTAILQLKDNAYGVTIHESVSGLSPKIVNWGAIYTTLDRLEDKGYVTSKWGVPEEERGGRPKRFYQVTKIGAAALTEAIHTSKLVTDTFFSLGRIKKWLADEIE